MSLTLSLKIRENIGTPQQKKAYNQGLFTRVAHEYDRVTALMSFGRDQSWKRRLVAGLPALAAPRCVDLACGTGDVTLLLGHKYPDGEVLGIDLTEPMLAVARQRCTLPHLAFRQADMCRLNLPGGWADVVTGSYAIRNAPVLDDALGEIHRVLRPGGWAALLDFSKSPSRLLQRLQLPLLKGWTSLCSILVHGAPEHAYIAESLRLFPDRLALRERLRAHGFTVQSSRPCFGGMLELLFLRK